MNIKRFFSSGIIFAALIPLLVSCLDEDTHYEAENETPGFSVATARVYFEKFLTEFEVFPYTTNKTRAIDEVVVYPLWSQAKEFTLEEIPTIEVPYNTEYSALEKAYETEDSIQVTNHISRKILIIQTDEEGELKFYTAEMISNDKFHKLGDQLFANFSLATLENFSGEVMYYNMKGESIGGYIYDEGKQVGSITPEILPEDSYNQQLPGTIPETKGWKQVEVCTTEVWRMTDCYWKYTGSRGEGSNDGYEYVCEVYYTTKTVCHYEDVWVDEGEGGNEGGSGGGGDGETPKPDPNAIPTFNISVSQTAIPIMEDYSVTIHNLQPVGAIIESTELQIRKVGNMNFIPFPDDKVTATSSKIETRAFSPGNFELQVEAKIKVGTKTHTYIASQNIVSVEHFYPDATFVQMVFNHKFESIWTKTIDAANSSTCREYGGVMFVDTRIQSYYFVDRTGNTFPSSMSQGAKVDLGFEETGEKGIIMGGYYCIGVVHTHPPRYWIPKSAGLVPVGPSVDDDPPPYNIPAFVIDYVPTKTDKNGNPFVPAGHPVNAAKQIYQYGGSRRDTPN